MVPHRSLNDKLSNFIRIANTLAVDTPAVKAHIGYTPAVKAHSEYSPAKKAHSEYSPAEKAHIEY